ncbi:phytase [Microbulbifer sp. CAU 1566]|uniref:phytase n=1 Tax=Microbulbifer sp. CAU 1566 TaxID=2933269 RepID=UPI002004D0D5|nr:phytase [Microbulbifer sp. CAU 1566]MCK7598692.1 phytase [Microbulbifer sp. CAU 1566]
MAFKTFYKVAAALATAGVLSACGPQIEKTAAEPKRITSQQQLALTDVVSSQLAPLALGGKDYLLLASEKRGLVLVTGEGEEKLALDGGTVERFALQQLADDSWLIAVYDEDGAELQLRLLDVEDGSPRIRYLASMATTAPQVAMCFSRQAGRTHLFAIDENGLGHEYVVHPREQAWEFTGLRPLYFGEQVSSCVVDDRSGKLLVAQPPLGIWSLNADAEMDEAREVFVAASELPAGEFGGLWLDSSSGNLWLTGGEKVLAFNINAPGQGPLFVEALADIEPVSAAVQQGALLALEEESDQVHRFAVTLPEPVAEMQAFRSPVEIPRVRASGQTAPVQSGGDAADDPAIWVNPVNPSASLILGTDKKSGLSVYDLNGKLLEHFAVGRVNNVDLRPMQHGKFVAIAAATNRTDPGVSLFGISAAGEVEYLGLRNLEMDDPYGLCVYRKGADLMTWVSDKDGAVQLLQIVPGTGNVDWSLEKVATLQVESQVEGCVVDDEKQMLFFGEEDGGIWRLDIAAFLSGEAKPQLIAPVDGERLAADVEGMGLYHAGDKSYLVVSSQGNNSYALFSRDGSQFVGHFKVDINLDKNLDGSSETDGLEVSSASFGSQYPQGLLVVQDGRNRMPSQTQNFKLVSWADIAETLQLK